VATVLLVTLTIVTAASAFLWMDGFTGERNGTERAAASSQAVDMDGDTDTEWIQLTLTAGQNAPYSGDDIVVDVTGPDGSPVEALCKTGQYAGGCLQPFDTSPGTSDTWDTGHTRWIPCQQKGAHILTLHVKDTPVLDASLICDTSP
jgi:FlaG/FlaF family flagellin (archaellin)